MNKKTAGYITFQKEELNLLKKVSPEALATYFRLRERMNVKRGDFMSFPSQSRLASDLGYSIKSIDTVKRLTKELEQVGLLRVLRTRNPHTRVWNSNQYHFKVLAELSKGGYTLADVVGYTSGIVNNYKEVNKEEPSEEHRTYGEYAVEERGKVLVVPSVVSNYHAGSTGTLPLEEGDSMSSQGLPKADSKFRPEAKPFDLGISEEERAIAIANAGKLITPKFTQGLSNKRTFDQQQTAYDTKHSLPKGE